MTDANETRDWVPEPAAAAPAPKAPAVEDSGAADGAGAAQDRPEVPVAASFAGGFLLAMLIRRLAR